MIITPCCYPKQLHQALETARRTACCALNSSGDVTLSHVLTTLVDAIQPCTVTVAMGGMSMEVLRTVELLMERTVFMESHNLPVVQHLNILLDGGGSLLQTLHNVLGRYGDRVSVGCSTNKERMVAFEGVTESVLIMGEWPLYSSIVRSQALMMTDKNAEMNELIGWVKSDIRVHRIASVFPAMP